MNMKRIVLFLLTNIAVLAVVSIILSILGVDGYLTGTGINYGSLLIFAAVFGFTGSFISLLISKQMAKWGTGARVIKQPSNQTEAWLLERVQYLANKAGISMPEVAIFEGAPNAFATGPSKSNSLVAVSTGLLQSMNRREVEAVLAHEVAHIANGDMVTMTLIQGVLNTFVIFISRAAAYAVDSFLRSSDEEQSGPGLTYFVVSVVFQIVFGILASVVVMYFSRQREYRADAGAVFLLGDRRPMIEALQALGGIQAGELPQEMAASGISGNTMKALFSTHPPLEDRIKALQHQA
jgi:heat shock protein HtpX